MSTAHVPTEFEAFSELEISTAEELVGRFLLALNESPTSQAGYKQAVSEPIFGDKFADHMAYIRWTKEEGRSERGVVPYGPLALIPGTAVLHYSQDVLEGIKAYRYVDGSVWTFRPVCNAARLNHSALCLALSEIDRDDLLVSLVDYVRVDEKWVPTGDGTSLYLRSLLFASGEFLSVHAFSVTDYYVIGSPSGLYFTSGFAGVAIWVMRGYHRAGPGGMGSAKCGGNYVVSLMPQPQMAEKGFSQICFLGTYEGRYPEGLSGMNMFVVIADGIIHTLGLVGAILRGGAHSVICRMLRSQDTLVHEGMIALDELVTRIRSGGVMEVFAYGTVAVTIPIIHLANDDFDVELPVGKTAKRIHGQFTDIRVGYMQDPFGWTYRLV